VLHISFRDILSQATADEASGDLPPSIDLPDRGCPVQVDRKNTTQKEMIMAMLLQLEVLTHSNY
jgi:hypothetical protein